MTGVLLPATTGRSEIVFGKHIPLAQLLERYSLHAMANWSPPRRTLLFVAGTRPEALKLAPVIRAVRRSRLLAAEICATAQHRDLLDTAFADLGIVADDDLDLMRHAQSPVEVATAVIAALTPMLIARPPAALIVQGDTASAYGAAVAGGYARVPVVHVEAGLRSGGDDPFPEEMHRRGIAQIATLHFAPTAAARAALRREGIADANIHVTGNTVIDALVNAADRIATDARLARTLQRQFADIDGGRPLVLATVHRRENHGPRLAGILDALAELAAGGAAVVVPVHPHPAIAQPLAARLGAVAHVHLLPPLDHPAFVYLLQRARLVLTDSGGVQEEAPAFGVPVLVLRDVTERPEGIAAGVARLVGHDRRQIVAAVRQLLDDEAAHTRMARAVLPYGDGRAGQRIAAVLEAQFAMPALRDAADLRSGPSAAAV